MVEPSSNANANFNISIKTKLDNFTLNIDRHFNDQGITGIFGHSGSGKSTLLRIIAGLEIKVQGEITFNKQVLFSSHSNIFIPTEQRNIGLVFQNSRLFPHLSVHQNLVFAQQRCKYSTLDINDIISLTGLSSLLAKKPAQLSGGEQQRVGLARAILAEPQLLLLDEPLSALDKHSKAQMLILITKVQQSLQIPMFYVSHSLAELQQVANNILILANGEVVDYGDIHQVIHRLNNTESKPLISPQTSLAVPIIAHDKEHALTQLALSEKQSIYLPLLTENTDENNDKEAYPPGALLRCFIFANDISITLNEPSDSSIVNHLSGTINAINKYGNHSILLTIHCAEQEFFAQISVMSYKKLALELGKNIFIQFKASAIKTLAAFPLKNASFIEE